MVSTATSSFLRTSLSSAVCVHRSRTAGLTRRPLSSIQLRRKAVGVCMVASSNKSVEATQSRRALLSTGALLALTPALPSPSHAGLFGNSLQDAFTEAIRLADTDLVAAEVAWGKAIKIAPDNSAAYSNRGAIRLVLGRYADALSDLEKSRDLDTAAYGYSSGFTVVSIGNAKGALGDWSGAFEEFQAARDDQYPGVAALADTSRALAHFQIGEESTAISEARALMSGEAEGSGEVAAPLVGMLWATGDQDGARALVETLGGEAAYASVVRSAQDFKQWTPRTVAAANAFLSKSQTATATDYDSSTVEYTFSQ